MNFLFAVDHARNDESAVKGLTFTGEIISDSDISAVDFDSVTFRRCRFVQCNFSGACFADCSFDGCDISSCNLSDSFWKNCTLTDCKADGAGFVHVIMRHTHITRTPCRYANFTRSVWEDSTFAGCDFRECALNEMKIRRCTFDSIDFTQADFFRTPLKSVDLSHCEIDGILVSDTRNELQGLKISAAQAPYIAAMLGVKIIS